MYSPAYSHSGRTNADGCHAGSRPYHCHGKTSKSYKKPNSTYSTYTKKKTYKNEDYYNDLFCDSIDGKREVRHYYQYNTEQSYVKVDCETDNYVYEGGLDKRSSLDSVQQAQFFSVLTGKKPAIVIFNTDDKYGKYEHRIKMVTQELGIKFILLDVKQ